MAARCFVRTFSGSLLAEVVDPTPEGVSWQRRAAGRCTTSMPSDDPAVAHLVHSSPVDGVVFRTAWDSDRELAWWADGLTPGVDPPTWCGPIVSVSHTWGRVTVDAFTQEWYLVRSVVGGDLQNWFSSATPGNDPSRSQWMTSGTVSTSTANANLWLEDASFIIDGPAQMMAGFELPVSPAGNQVSIGLAVRVDAGEPEGNIVAGVMRADDPMGGTSYGSPQFLGAVQLPENWQAGRWYFLSDVYQQPAGYGTRYTMILGASTGVEVTVGAVRAVRPQNASALAGDDWALGASALFSQQVALMPQSWTYDTDPTGVDLAGYVRWMSADHDQVTSALGDLDGMGEWWVEDGEMRWAPTRGSQVATMEITEADLEDFAFSVDASSASTEVIGQMTPDTGDLREQVRVSTGTGARLVTVDRVPDGIAPQDVHRWADGLLAASGPECSLSGVPVVWSGDPEDVLGDLGLGDWVECTVTDGSLSYVVEPAVDSLSWDPITGRVEPTWVLGGRRGQDPMSVLVAQMRAAERDRRTVNVPRQRSLGGPNQGIGPAPGDEVLSGGDLVGPWAGSVEVGDGTWTITVSHTCTNTLTGVVTARIDGGADVEAQVPADSIVTPMATQQATVLGPQVVPISASYWDETQNPTYRRVTWHAVRVR